MDDNTLTLLIALVNGVAAILVAWISSRRKEKETDGSYEGRHSRHPPDRDEPV